MAFTYVQPVLAKLMELAGKRQSPFATEMHSFTNKPQDIAAYINDFIEAAPQAGYTCLQHTISKKEVAGFIKSLHSPVLFFIRNENGQDIPLLVYPQKNGQPAGLKADNRQELPAAAIRELIPAFAEPAEGAIPPQPDQAIMLSFNQVIATPDEAAEFAEESAGTPSPLSRFYRLLKAEKKIISYIYIYAIMVGLISLVIPLGIQAIISLISGGLVFSSVVVLIAAIILSVVATGGLQIMQLTLVELLQQGVFTKAALEFAFRLPHITAPSLRGQHPPELMNRFFDVLNVQKALPKVLIDLSGAVLQILFGLILLAFYHPFFLAFGILLVAAVALVLRLTGAKGLKTSLYESKYKYKVVYWLEEVARALPSFRLAANSNLHLQKTNDFLNGYLHYRKSHFSVLRTQFFYIIIFKTLIIGGLLILGTLLVVDRQISLGQFVASEVIIVLVLAAVEKIIFNMDTIYDVLTAVDKIGQVTDLPLEAMRGAKADFSGSPNGVQVSVRDLRYHHMGRGYLRLRGVSFEIPAGARIGLTGTIGSGKIALAKVLAGINTDYEGSIMINNMSVRDLHPNTLRSVVDNNLSADGLFEGSLLENISVGRSAISYEDVWWAIEKTGLSAYSGNLPDGIYTHMGATGEHPPVDIIQRILLARCVASRPGLLVLHDDWGDWPQQDRDKLFSFLLDPSAPWTLVLVTGDHQYLSVCNQVLILENGELLASGNYNDLKLNRHLG